MVDNVRDAMLNVECSSVTLMFVPIKANESVQLIFLKGSSKDYYREGSNGGKRSTD